MAAISGKWLTDATWHRDPMYEVPHTPDPEHAQPGQVDENVTWQGQPYYDVEPGPDVVGLDFVTQWPGLVLDRTPDDHRDGGPHSFEPTQRQFYEAHSADLGADERSSYDEPTTQFASDRYDQVSVNPDGNRAVAPVALVRGLNSNEANNPPLESYGGHGWRYADYRWNFTEHDFSPPPRYHQYRLVRPNVASMVADTPPPAEPGPYNVPFSSLARAIRNLYRKPQIRRTPQPFDEAVITDGLDQDYAAAGIGQDWVSV